MNKRSKRDFFVFAFAVFLSTLAFGIGLLAYTQGAAGFFQALYGLTGILSIGVARFIAVRHKRQQRRAPIQAVRRRRPAPREPVFRVFDRATLSDESFARMQHGRHLEPKARHELDGECSA